MATPFLNNYAESPLTFQKFKKHPKNSNLMSFWAIMVSIFIYISVFYLFNLSPSTLLCTTKFWFIISNTLILIIAADFSASDYHDFRDENRKNVNIKPNIAIPSFETRHDEKKMPKHREEESVHEELPPREKIIGTVEENNKPKKKSMITDEKPDDDNLAGKTSRRENFDREKKPQVITRSASNPEVEIEAREVTKTEASRRVVRRLNSERSNASAAPGNSEKRALRKTLSERYDNNVEDEEEENEFSRMSDEELNRRVEEFIRRFNRQIRLQAARGPRNLV